MGGQAIIADLAKEAVAPPADARLESESGDVGLAAAPRLHPPMLAM